MNRGRPITNHAVHWSGEHEALLVAVANYVCDHFARATGWRPNRHELISEGWWRVARYCLPADLRRAAASMRREMYRYSAGEWLGIAGQLSRQARAGPRMRVSQQRRGAVFADRRELRVQRMLVWNEAKKGDTT